MNNIVYISPISSRSGYGDCSRDIAKVLLNMHSDSLKFLNTKWGNCPTTGLKDASEFNNTIKSNTIIKPESDVDVTYQVALPSEFKRLGKHNIGITAGLEFTHWPNEFVNGCNEMDKVIVHSEFTKQLLIDNKTKCTTDVRVIFQPVDEIYIKEQLNYNTHTCKMNNLLSGIEESFCFLSMGVFTKHNDRKNISKTVDVFQKTFTDTDHNTALVLKINGSRYNTRDLTYLQSYIKDLNAKFHKPKSVYLLYGDFSKNEIKSLYTHSKIKSMITLTHAEGFGRPLLEASVSSLPVIAPNWSGHVDFLPKKLTQLVGGKLEYVDNQIPYTTQESLWFHPDTEEVSECIMNTLQNYDHHKKNAEELSSINSKKYTQDNLQTLYKSVISDM